MRIKWGDRTPIEASDDLVNLVRKIGETVSSSEHAPPLTNDDVLGVCFEAIYGILLRDLLPLGKPLDPEDFRLEHLALEATFLALHDRLAVSKRWKKYGPDPSGRMLWLSSWKGEQGELVGKVQTVRSLELSLDDSIVRSAFFGAEAAGADPALFADEYRSCLARGEALEKLLAGLGLSFALASWETLREDALAGRYTKEERRETVVENRDSLARGWIDLLLSRARGKSGIFGLLCTDKEGRVRIGLRQARDAVAIDKRSAPKKLRTIRRMRLRPLESLDLRPASTDDLVGVRDAQNAVQAAIAAHLARSTSGSATHILLLNVIKLAAQEITLAELSRETGKSRSALSEAWAAIQEKLRTDLVEFAS